MTNPQTKSIIIGNYGCLAMVYAWCLGIEPQYDSEMIKIVSDAMDKGILDDDCTVSDASKYLQYLSGKKFIVTKKDITSIKDIKERTPVRFDFGTMSHWVGVENGQIAFNSLSTSNCVNKGKPTTARMIERVTVK